MRVLILAVLLLSVFLSLGKTEKKEYHAYLTGGAQRPPVDTDYTGHADLSYDSETGELEIKVTHDIPEITAAHLHGPADSDGTAGVLEDLQATEGEANDPLEYTTTIEDEDRELFRSYLDDGLTYINLHTEENEDGEIRGQVEEGGSDDDDDNTDIIVWVSVALGATALVAIVMFAVFYKVKISGNSNSNSASEIPSKAGSGGYKPQQDFA